MTKLQLRWVQAMRDRHGRMRHYFRRPGHQRVTLPGLPGSPEFMDAYHAALAGETAPRRQIGLERTVPGSIAALIIAYYGSAEYKALSASTHKGYRSHLERFRREHGDKPVALLKPHHLRAILDKMSGTPGAANNLRKRLRTLMQFAVERNWREDNPVMSIRRPRGRRGDGFIPWSEEDIARYEEHWPSGTKERLALALFLYTGQRRSDVVTMGRQYVQGGKIRVRQVKTETRLAIPIHPKLQREIDLAPADRMTFLVTEFGKPFTQAGFGAWFRKRAIAAGLTDRTAHGLRKASLRRLAEAGCTTKQIASIGGHRSLSEVEHYTRDADQERLADEAIRKLKRSPPRPKRERPL